MEAGVHGGGVGVDGHGIAVKPGDWIILLFDKQTSKRAEKPLKSPPRELSLSLRAALCSITFACAVYLF